MESVAIAIAGIRGRMGRQIAQLAAADAALELVGGTVRPGDELAGQAFSVSTGDQTTDVPIADSLSAFGTAQIVIDFTAPGTTLALIDQAGDSLKGMVIGTTGYTPEQEQVIADAATRLAIVKAGNMSLGVNLLSVLVEQAAAALGEEFDIEIHEAHHRHKKDAPSGTALMLGEAAARGRGISLDGNDIRTRDGITGERAPGKIGFSVTRAGGIIGDHDVQFGSSQEILSLSHKALDRAVFASGALTAAKWLAAQEFRPGLYSMRDVLGI